MDYNERETLVSSFPSNSKTRPVSQDIPEGKKLEKVVTGTVKTQKRSIGKKFAEVFFEDDVNNVKSYIFNDVILYGIKIMICEVVGRNGFVEQLLLGGGNSRRNGRRGPTSYDKQYVGSSLIRNNRDDRRDISRQARARHEFNEIVLESRGEAEEVLSELIDRIEHYGWATVADLYDLVGVTGNWADQKHGWANLSNATVNRVRDGYLINLPRTQPLD